MEQSSMNSPIKPSVAQKSAVFLISGFLGAGKTTLLKQILAWESDLSDTVILVNEFGKVGIDGDLLKNCGSDVVELSSGCICCTLSSDLQHSLERIWETYKPRKIFIEASGVADPTSILPVLRHPHLADCMQLQKVVTVLDVDYWPARDHFGPLFYNQLETADLILLNKVDQVDAAEIPLYLKEIHDCIPDCRVVPTVRCAIDPETLWAPAVATRVVLKPMHLFRQAALADGADANRESGNTDRQGDGKSVRADNFVTFSFEKPQILDPSCFQQFIETLPYELFRMKGSVRFGDRTEFVNFVGGKCEWSAWDGQPGTRLAFIGWNIDAGPILDRLERCRLSP
jgi:G3E family GTPase